MNIGEGGAKEEDEVMFHEVIENDIKTEILKEEPKEAVFPMKSEICNENSDDEKVCVHYKNDRPGNAKQKQDDRLQEPLLFSSNNLQNNGDGRSKVDNTDCSSSQKQEESIIKLIEADITIKQEEFLDTPEYVSMNIDFVDVESQPGQVKTEHDDDIFYENGKIAKFKEEPTDNESTLNSNLLGQDEISIEDVKSDFSEESQEGSKREIRTDSNNFTTDAVTETRCSKIAEKPHRCTFCSKTFSWRYRLVMHRRIHKVGKPFQCNVCSKWFSSEYQLVSHQKAHTGEMPFQCDTCSKSFVSNSLLADHQKLHTGKKPFQCTLCSISFNQRWSLDAHKKIHDMRNSTSYKVSLQSFPNNPNSSSLTIHRSKIHKREKHSSDRPHKCEVCAKSYIRCGDLTRHMIIHNKERPNECEICSKYFIHCSSLIAHQKIHNEEMVYKCEVCSKRFIRRLDLISHEEIHNEKRPFKCELCSKYFIQRGHLYMHEKIHVGLRPYKCEVCSKSFLRRCGLVSHEKIHNEERPYECDVCSKSFSVNSYLVAHQKIHERPVK